MDPPTLGCQAPVGPPYRLTIVGEAADTILFCTILFYGEMTLGNFINYTVTGYFYKVLLEVILLPLTYPVIAAIRRTEGLKKDEVFD